MGLDGITGYITLPDIPYKRPIIPCMKKMKFLVYNNYTIKCTGRNYYGKRN